MSGCGRSPASFTLSSSDAVSVSPVHCGSIRQTATILSMSRDCLRTGDKATVHFRFIKTPEYMHCDHKLVFREGRTKAVGTVTKVREVPNRLARSHDPPLTPPLCPQLLQAASTQAARAQQAKMQPSRNKDGGEEARPSSPNAAPLQVRRG